MVYRGRFFHCEILKNGRIKAGFSGRKPTSYSVFWTHWWEDGLQKRAFPFCLQKYLIIQERHNCGSVIACLQNNKMAPRNALNSEPRCISTDRGLHCARSICQLEKLLQQMIKIPFFFPLPFTERGCVEEARSNVVGNDIMPVYFYLFIFVLIYIFISENRAVNLHEVIA